MPNQKPNFIILLSALLLAIVVGVAAVWWFLPAAQPPTPSRELTAPQPPAAAPDSVSEFNVKLFDRSAYQNLNHSLVTSGNLPVQPPATTGKANPFL